MTDSQDGVVLLHGISRTSRSFQKMQTALEAAGFATLNVGYASRSKPIEALAEDIHPAVERFAESLDGSVHFVCHSMGGLLARVYVARQRPQRLGRMVMLGTPNGGSEIADRLKHIGVYRAWFGPAGQQLVTQRDAAVAAMFPPVDYPVGLFDQLGIPAQTARWQGVGREHQARRHGRSYRYGDVAPMAGAEWSCDRADDCVPAGWGIPPIVAGRRSTFRRRKSRIVPAISWRCVSSAKWPVS
jgi:pimeloyl-ACP methyl ester carboxylesterase